MSDTELIIFPWNHNFETGIKKVDEQHHHLFLLVNKLANTLIYDNRVEVDEIFNDLKEYAHYHFAYEEGVWSRCFSGDEWNEEHQQCHSTFVKDVNKIQAESKTLSWQESIEHILHFLIRWLVFHILGDDKKMGLALKEFESTGSLNQAKTNALNTLQGIHGLVTDTVLKMYFEVSTQSIELVREKHRRFVAERELKKLNTKLQKLAITDELSGLYNRRYFNMMMPDLLSRARKESSIVSFVFIDIDHFKLLNDRLGHLKGDEAISKLGSMLSDQFYELDETSFRMGGEEFLVVIIGADHQEVVCRAEDTRKAIANILISNENKGVQHELTSSIGVYSCLPSETDDANYLLDNVDKCLYHAKLNGRNKVVSLCGQVITAEEVVI